MNVREQLDSIEQVKDLPPLNIASGGGQHHRRYHLIGGGYIALCNRTNPYMDFFNPVPYVIVRHIGLGGIGILSYKKLKIGADYIIALPSEGSVIGQVVHCSPNNLLPKFYRSTIRWHQSPSSTQILQWLPFIKPQDTIDFERDYQLVMEAVTSSSPTPF